MYKFSSYEKTDAATFYVEFTIMGLSKMLSSESRQVTCPSSPPHYANHPTTQSCCKDYSGYALRSSLQKLCLYGLELREATMTGKSEIPPNSHETPKS